MAEVTGSNPVSPTMPNDETINGLSADRDGDERVEVSGANPAKTTRRAGSFRIRWQRYRQSSVGSPPRGWNRGSKLRPP